MNQEKVNKLQHQVRQVRIGGKVTKPGLALNITSFRSMIIIYLSSPLQIIWFIHQYFIKSHILSPGYTQEKEESCT